MPRNDFNNPESSPIPRKSRSSVPQPRPPKQTPPLVKTLGIKTLRSTIRGLEKLVETLEAEPSEQSLHSGIPPKRSLWQNVLIQVRSRLPKKLRRNLNDRALTGLVAGIVVICFWFTSTLFSSTPSPKVASDPPQSPPEIASQPTVSEPTVSEPTVSKPDASQPVEPAPSPSVVPTPPVESIPSDLSSPDSAEIPVASEPKIPLPDVSETPDSVIVAAEPTSDSISEPIVEPAKPTVASEPQPKPSPVAIEPVPPQPPEPQPEPIQLTPEQSLIASIQGQVSEISDRYISTLVQSVQPNFRSSRLVVQVGEGWYQLSPQQQDQLSNELWARSQELDFINLHLRDPNGMLIARSPVVGSSMVILKRSPNLQKTV